MFRKYYEINGGMYFDTINWSGATKFACVADKVALRRASRLESLIGCPNKPVNGQLFCEGQPYLDPIVPVNTTCDIQCFDGYGVNHQVTSCIYTPLRLPDPTKTMWSNPLACMDLLYETVNYETS